MAALFLVLSDAASGPPWWVPLTLAALLSFLLGALLGQLRGWDRFAAELSSLRQEIYGAKDTRESNGLKSNVTRAHDRIDDLIERLNADELVSLQVALREERRNITQHPSDPHRPEYGPVPSSPHRGEVR